MVEQIFAYRQQLTSFSCEPLRRFHGHQQVQVSNTTYGGPITDFAQFEVRIHQGLPASLLAPRGFFVNPCRPAWLWAPRRHRAPPGPKPNLRRNRDPGFTNNGPTMAPPPPVRNSGGYLSNMAPGNLIDGLSQMPMFYNNATPESTVGGQNSGGSNVNLRGAGARRTLTLLNGRRLVSSNRFGSVDINVVPEELLRSVESVTGGASASYGTDAVAGVVNFLLDTDYEVSKPIRRPASLKCRLTHLGN